MYKRIIYVLIVVFLISWIPTAVFCSNSDAESVFEKAKKLEENFDYSEASKLYKAAREESLNAGDNEMANACRIRMFEMEKVLGDYNLPKETVKDMLAENFKDVPKDIRDSWIKDGKIEYMIIDGKPRYYDDFVKNIMYRNPALMDKEGLEREMTFALKYHEIIYRSKDGYHPEKSWNPYINPVTFLITEELNLPRKELPASGVLKIWFPVPIISAAQREVKIISVSPDKFVKYPPSIDSDLGILFMEIPLDEVKEDIHAKIKILFSHCEQRFLINPKNIGDYDKKSVLYKKYTKSDRNVSISPQIQQKAKDLVGLEKNPYLAAKNIYDYVVNNIKYSHMPHCTLNTLNRPESVYVYNNGYGDCGAQSAYFSALCRAIGIPARTTGGYQLCPGLESTHFWAEFYLPYYGWIPVDTSIAQTVDFNSDKISENQRNQFKNFYFGNQDPYRLIIQKDLDVPIVPKPTEPVLFSMALQMPMVECKTSEKNLGILAVENFKITYEQIES